MKKRILSCVLSAALLLGLTPWSALATDDPLDDQTSQTELQTNFHSPPLDPDIYSDPPPNSTIGEVGLTGELRSVNHLSERLSEVHRLGFETCIIPKQRKDQIRAPQGLALIEARNIAEALRAIVQA